VAEDRADRQWIATLIALQEGRLPLHVGGLSVVMDRCTAVEHQRLVRWS